MTQKLSQLRSAFFALLALNSSLPPLNESEAISTDLAFLVQNYTTDSMPKTVSTATISTETTSKQQFDESKTNAINGGLFQSIEPKKETEICNKDLRKMYFRNAGNVGVLSDVKLKRHQAKKITYTKNNITGDFFSTEAEDYPELSKIENLLKKIAEEKNVFCRDYVPETKTHPTNPGGGTVVPLCISTTDSITPRKIRNSKGDYVKVVNYDQYEQTMFVEVCSDSLDTSCGGFAKHFPNGYQALCRQHYIYRRTAIFADNPKYPDKPDVVFEDIPIPASCVCDLIIPDK